MSPKTKHPADAATGRRAFAPNYAVAPGATIAEALAEKGMSAYDFGPDLADVLAEYLAKQGPDFAPKLDGRITVK